MTSIEAQTGLNTSQATIINLLFTSLLSSSYCLNLRPHICDNENLLCGFNDGTLTVRIFSPISYCATDLT